MKHSDKVKAIKFIAPNAQFNLIGDELEWLDENESKPTEAQIKAGWIAFEKEQASQAQAKAEAKAIAQAKLAALGLTVEDLQALGL
jgi:hypothetical protein